MSGNDRETNVEYQWKKAVNRLTEPISGTSNKEGTAITTSIYCFHVFETVCLYLFVKRGVDHH